MARSKEALQRRAEKRNRSMEQQRRADAQEMERQIAKHSKTRAAKSTSTTTVTLLEPQTSKPEPSKTSNQETASTANTRNDRSHERKVTTPNNARNQDTQMTATATNDNTTKEQQVILQEAGSWICMSCGNHNFASRRYCNSKTCNERRPKELEMPQYNGPGKRRHNDDDGRAPKKKPKQSRHDPETSKVVEWAPNASSALIKKNMELRKLYQETNGQGMSEEDIQRAKLLLERDARKREKKLNKKNKNSATESSAEATTTTTSTPETTGDNEDNKEQQNDKDQLKDLAKQIRKENKKLRKKYLKTNGEGMSADDIERAKILIDRDERKRQKREAAAEAAKNTK